MMDIKIKDSIEDFEAAFICINNSPNGHFETSEDLMRALQGCGRNPSPKTVIDYWKKYKKIGLEEFVEIAKSEKVISERELVEAFRSIDIDNNGYLSYREFVNLFTNEGDKMSGSEIRRILDEADINQDSRLNYREFVNLIMSTIKKAKKVAKKKMEIILHESENELNHRRRKFKDDYYDDHQKQRYSHSSLSLKSNRSLGSSEENIRHKTRKSNSRISFNDDSDLEKKSTKHDSLKNLKGMVNATLNDLKSSKTLRDSLNGSDVDLKKSRKHESSYENLKALVHRERDRRRYDEADLHVERNPRGRDRSRDRSRDRLRSESSQGKSRDGSRERRRDHSRDRERSRDRSRERSRERRGSRSSMDRFKTERRDKYRENSRERERYRNQDDKYDDRNDRRRSLSRESRSSRISKDEEYLDKKNKKLTKLFETIMKPFNKIAESIQEPKNLKKWKTKTIKGGFYFSPKSESIASNYFVLDLLSTSTIFFSIEAYKTPLHSNSNIVDMDLALMIVKDGKSLTLKGLTENKIKNKWCIQLDLKPGVYLIYPFTTGCHLRKPNLEISKSSYVNLFQRDSNYKFTLTRQFSDALSTIFDMCDLDGNGRLSMTELNLFTLITSNETISHKYWKFIEDTVGLKKNELTKEAFISLYKMQASDRKDENYDDLYEILENMGFNKALKIDQSAPYIINVSSEKEDFEILYKEEIYDLKRQGEKILLQAIESEGKVKETKIRGLDAIEFQKNHWSAVAFRNTSEHEIRLELNGSKSENCLTSHQKSATDLKIKPYKSKVAMFFTASNQNKEWIIRCSYALN